VVQIEFASFEFWQNLFHSI